jgi:TRAP-type mannitol/chloroaromatic compound transport system substrate-binding protein
VSINLELCKGLPDDLKEVLQEATIAFNQDSLAANAELDQGFADARDPETLIDWGPEERRELREIAQEVWQEWAAKSEMATKVYESHLAYMQEQGLL